MNHLIYSSQGELTANARGEVIFASGPNSHELAHIKRFNMATLTDTELDILDVGYWSQNGVYEPPMFETRAGLVYHHGHRCDVAACPATFPRCPDITDEGECVRESDAILCPTHYAEAYEEFTQC